MKKPIVRIAGFLLVLVLVLGYLDSVFKFKYGDGIYSVKKFYELEDGTVDVLILGSSHAFENINTGTLWDEGGIAAYIMGGSIQPLWNTYYYLKEALKTQAPSLIILEGYCVTMMSEYIDDSRIIKNNYGLHWSRDKVESLKVSAPEERWPEFMLEYMQYHTRYKELSAADFRKNQGNPAFADYKGFGCNMITAPQTAADVRNVTEREALFEKSEDYYRAILALAKEHGIPVLVLISPYAGITERQQKMYNMAEYVAAQYDAPFLNGNLLVDEIGLDYSTDAGDASHLNYKGNQKFTRYLYDYLKNHYTLPDRRGDARYASWQRHADYIRQIIEDQQLAEDLDLGSIAQRVRDENYWTFVTVDGTCDTSDPNLQSFFAALDIPTTGASGIWHMAGGTMTWYSQMEATERYIRLPHHDLCLRRTANEDGTWTDTVLMDRTPYQKVSNGVNIVVYDTLSERIVTTVGVDAANGYAVVK